MEVTGSEERGWKGRGRKDGVYSSTTQVIYSLLLSNLTTEHNMTLIFEWNSAKMHCSNYMYTGCSIKNIRIIFSSFHTQMLTNCFTVAVAAFLEELQKKPG